MSRRRRLKSKTHCPCAVTLLQVGVTLIYAGKFAICCFAALLVDFIIII
jgi:hypothetical protein